MFSRDVCNIRISVIEFNMLDLQQKAHNWTGYSILTTRSVLNVDRNGENRTAYLAANIGQELYTPSDRAHFSRTCNQSSAQLSNFLQPMRLHNIRHYSHVVYARLAGHFVAINTICIYFGQHFAVT